MDLAATMGPSGTVVFPTSSHQLLGEDGGRFTKKKGHLASWQHLPTILKMCCRHGRRRAGGVFIWKKPCTSGEPAHRVATRITQLLHWYWRRGCVLCGLDNFPNNDGFVVLLLLFFFFLICKWTLTFYGLKSTDSRTLHSASLL